MFSNISIAQSEKKRNEKETFSHIKHYFYYKKEIEL